MKMKIVGIILAIYTTSANASICFDKIAELNQKLALTAGQAKCVDSNSDFADSKALLCTVDQKGISGEYARYLKLQQEYQAAFDAYSNEKDPVKKGPLLQKVVSADQRWMLAGRGEIDYALLQFSAVVTSCQK